MPFNFPIFHHSILQCFKRFNNLDWCCSTFFRWIYIVIIWFIFCEFLRFFRRLLHERLEEGKQGVTRPKSIDRRPSCFIFDIWGFRNIFESYFTQELCTNKKLHGYLFLLALVLQAITILLVGTILFLWFTDAFGVIHKSRKQLRLYSDYVTSLGLCMRAVIE